MAFKVIHFVFIKDFIGIPNINQILILIFYHYRFYSLLLVLLPLLPLRRTCNRKELATETAFTVQDSESLDTVESRMVVDTAVDTAVALRSAGDTAEVLPSVEDTAVALPSEEDMAAALRSAEDTAVGLPSEEDLDLPHLSVEATEHPPHFHPHLLPSAEDMEVAQP